jgi:hypothetical protein
LTIVLALASTGIVLLIAHRAIQGTQAERLLATPPRHYDAISLNLDVPHSAVSLEPIRDHALFYASRAFYVPPPPSAEPATPPKPDYLLAGTFIIPRKPTVALLNSRGTGAVRKVVPGDDLDGWHVQGVEIQRVVLDYKGQQIEIVRDVHAKSGGLTVAPIVRTSAPKAALAVASTADGSAQPVADSTSEPVRAVKVLGNGGTPQAALREASANSSRPHVEARLYRPPPQ